jgi:ADP-ribose pyrophosphatase YjhB (NUDIX family)
MLHHAECPQCRQALAFYKNPKPTVDAIIELSDRRIVLVRRRNFPFGWALPGGFIDYGETAEDAVRREALEETGLIIALRGLLGVYSAPGRDPRGHTIATVFVATADGEPNPGDDAAGIRLFAPEELPAEMAFDHANIVADYLRSRFRHSKAP